MSLTETTTRMTEVSVQRASAQDYSRQVTPSGLTAHVTMRHSRAATSSVAAISNVLRQDTVHVTTRRARRVTSLARASMASARRRVIARVTTRTRRVVTSPARASMASVRRRVSVRAITPTGKKAAISHVRADITVVSSSVADTVSSARAATTGRAVTVSIRPITTRMQSIA